MIDIIKSIIYIAQPTSNIDTLLDMFSFAIWTIYLLTFLSIIVFRIKEPFKNEERPFRDIVESSTLESSKRITFVLITI